MQEKWMHMCKHISVYFLLGAVSIFSLKYWQSGFLPQFVIPA